MRLNPWRCPECDQPAKGIFETIPGIARLHVAENGSAQYAGETDVCWDDQESIRDEQGRVTLICAAGHEWPAVMDENDPQPNAEPEP